MLGEIASASQEQADGIGQVNTGVGELDKVTQSNAGNAEELSSASEETAAQVATLRELVARFKINAETASAARATPASTTSQKIRQSDRAASAVSQDDSPEAQIPLHGKDEGFESF